MASSCLEQQQHKSFHPPHHLYKKSTLRDIDIPPRKLLNRRAAATATSPEAYMADTMYQNESPRVMPEETLFKKFLPYNTGADSDDEEGDPYAADHFRIYEFKVRKCTRSRSHDWTDCPFAHPGEKARRRCPRRYNYLGTVCADFRRGSCSRGDLCEFAHGVFECWLHPSRYRTEACKDGKNCQRKICFFAHTQSQLRVVPPEPVVPVKKYHSESSSSHSRCCAHCRCHLDIHHTNSPTSTLNIDLDSLSPPASPPFSPARSAVYSPISRFADRLGRTESFGMTQMGQSASNNSIIHKDCMNHEMMSNHAINELMRSMEAMSVVDDQNSRWMDSCYINGSSTTGGYGGDQFDVSAVMNPSPCGTDMGRVFGGDSLRQNVYTNNSNGNNEVSSSSVNGPDLGWVNDLLT